MRERYIDGILAYVDGEMTSQYRAAVVAELQELEGFISKYSKEAEEWAVFAERARVELDKPADLRERTIARYERKLRLLSNSIRLRGYLLAELNNQPSFRPAFAYKN